MTRPRYCGGKMDPIVAGIISSILTTVIGGVGLWTYRIIKLKGEYSLKQKAKENEEKREDNSRYIEELYRLVGALRMELSEVKAELKAEKAKHQTTQEDHSFCRERIARLEAWYQATTGHPLPDLHDSDIHRPLPPTSGRIQQPGPKSGRIPLPESEDSNGDRVDS